MAEDWWSFPPTRCMAWPAIRATRPQSTASIRSSAARASRRCRCCWRPSTSWTSWLDLPSPLNRLAAQFLPGAFSPIAVARRGLHARHGQRHPAGQAYAGHPRPEFGLDPAYSPSLGPLAASSANRSGDESAQTVEEAVQAFGDDVQLYLDGGPTQGHVASTVVAADPHERDGIVILREGVIPQPVVRKAVHMNGGGLGA